MTAYVPGLEEKDIKKVIRSVRELASGRSNATGRVTLKASATTTIVADQNCALGTVPLLVPTTADAAAELKNGTLFITVVANGSFTITHANSPSTNRIFLYAFIG